MKGVDEGTASLKYLIGSWFLYDSFHYCTQSPVLGDSGGHGYEWMHFATGVMVGNVRTIERIVTFPLAKQSPVYVEGEPMATRDVLIEMSEYGYALHAVCHSHPGVGIMATKPSSIDRDHQERLERGGYPVVSCIYSRDGFVRFFSVNRPFAIEVYGKGVKRIGDTTFHLTTRC